MTVPLVCGAIITTAAPHTAEFFGSFTGALFTGALPIIAVFFVCMGSSISVRSMPRAVRRGGALMATKLALGLAPAFFSVILSAYSPSVPAGLREYPRLPWWQPSTIPTAGSTWP